MDYDSCAIRLGAHAANESNQVDVCMQSEHVGTAGPGLSRVRWESAGLVSPTAPQQDRC
jgi:hypothetical protein